MIARLTDWQVTNLYLVPQMERLERMKAEGDARSESGPPAPVPAPGLPDRETFLRAMGRMGCPPDAAAARYYAAGGR